MMRRKQSTTSYPIPFLMVDSADHVTGKTGLSPTVTISKNGAGFGAAAGAVAEVANGWYTLAGNATDRDTLGTLLIHASASGADATDAACEIVAYDPFDTTTESVAALLDATNTSSNDATKVGGQIRRTHALAGGTKSSMDTAAANPTTLHRNEADAATLITETRTESGTTETITPT